MLTTLEKLEMLKDKVHIFPIFGGAVGTLWGIAWQNIVKNPNKSEIPSYVFSVNSTRLIDMSRILQYKEIA